MADLKITELPPISGGAVQPNRDFLALADSSASETKKVTPKDVVLNTLAQPEANGGIPDGTVDPDKINWDGIDPNVIDGDAIENGSLVGDKLVDNSVAGQKLIDNSVNASTKLLDLSITEIKYGSGSVSTRALADASVTTAKLAANAAAGNIQNRTLDGDVLIDGTVSNAKLETIQTDIIGDNAITTDKIGANQVVSQHIANDSIENRHLNDNITDSDGGLTVNPDGLAIENTIAAGSQAGINYDEHGLITGIAADGLVPRTDLPLATATEVGAVSVPVDGGLEVSGTGAISHQNDITAASFAGITFDTHGHVTATDTSGKIPQSYLPVAGTTPENIGAIYIPDQEPLRIEVDGALYHQNTNVTPGVYTKVGVSITGHVIDGGNIEQSDIPDLDASIITTGQFGSNRIEDGSITGPKIDDYATCLMQEDFPGQGDFLGQFWYTPSTAQLRVYSRGSGPQNIWLPVGFGLLQQQNLRFAFTFDATTSTIVSITQYGAPLGLAVGDPIPAATDVNAGAYGVCVVDGTGITLHDVNGTNFTIGDWILSAGEVAGWQHINTIDGGGGGAAMFLNDLLDVTVPTPAVPLQDGQILQYNGDFGQWVNVPNTAAVTIGDTPPNNAASGTLWWDTESGRLFIWYEEAAGSDQTSQWVPATPESGITGSGNSPTPTLKFLNDLDDVEAGKFAGALLRYNSANLRWESSTLIDSGTFAGTFNATAPPTPLDVVEPKNLNDLNDVNATNTDKAFLQYNAGTSNWESQLNFDGGTFPVVFFTTEDYVAPSIIGTTTIENLNDFLDVEVQEIDEAYVIYNDNLNRWEETTTISGGTF